MKSSQVDRFWFLRCPIVHINLSDMIGSFASSATASLMAQNGFKQNIPLLWIKSSPVARFWCLGCLNHHIDLSNIIRSFASYTTNSLVAKNKTKKIS